VGVGFGSPKREFVIDKEYQSVLVVGGKDCSAYFRAIQFTLAVLEADHSSLFHRYCLYAGVVAASWSSGRKHLQIVLLAILRCGCASSISGLSSVVLLIWLAWMYCFAS